MLRRKEFHKFLGYAQSADEVFQVLDFRHFPFGENRRPLARLTSARLAHVPFSRHKLHLRNPSRIDQSTPEQEEWQNTCQANIR